MRFKDSARRRCLEETESRLTRFVIYALSARTIGQCSRFQSLSLGFVADIVLIDARERSFSKVTLFDSNRREGRGEGRKETGETRRKDHERALRWKLELETKDSHGNFRARLYAFILEYRVE